MHECACGCGELIEDISKHRGEYKIYKRGHCFRGKKFSLKHKEGIRRALQGKKKSLEHRNSLSRVFSDGRRRDSGNINWKGDDVGYWSLHIYMRRHLPTTGLCQICGRKKTLDLACFTHEYNRKPENWMWLCRSCHTKIDIRYYKFLKTGSCL